MSTQPARGMRDFLPDDVRRREYVVGVVREVYDRYGFEPLETPAVENIETLLGKYGDEGNKLIFKILMRGEHEASGQADLALRYDLTVPLARVVAEYQSRLPRFFKRYQIQPVWRADRPARGRFREFYQCDIDSVGSTSPAVEAEQIAAVSEILAKLGFNDFSIRLNHRGILAGILAWAEVPESLQAVALVALDKRDKIGDEGVHAELLGRGLAKFAADRLLRSTGFLPNALDPDAEINSLQEQIGHIPAAAAGLENLKKIMQLSSAPLQFDKSLARGLSYYTGAIMEINVKDLAGSIGGGGRYDDLVGMFLGNQVPACGFSLGLERILVVMQERGLFPDVVSRSAVDVVVAALDADALPAAMAAAAELRGSGLRVDLFPEPARKMDRVFKHVDQRHAHFIAVVGADEMAAGTLTIRNVAARTRETVPRAEAASAIRRAQAEAAGGASQGQRGIRQ